MSDSDTKRKKGNHPIESNGEGSDTSVKKSSKRRREKQELGKKLNPILFLAKLQGGERSKI